MSTRCTRIGIVAPRRRAGILKATRALGLTVPASLLARADEVIR